MVEAPNPYSPPAAQADADLARLRSRQQARRLLTALAGASAASNLAIMWTLGRLQLPVSLRIVTTTLLLYLIYLRHAWARWLFVCLLALSLTLNARTLPGLHDAMPLWIVLQSSWFALHLSMLILLVAAPSIRDLYRRHAPNPISFDTDSADDDDAEDEDAEHDDNPGKGATS